MKPESGRAMRGDHAYTFAGACELRADCGTYINNATSPPAHKGDDL